MGGYLPHLVEEVFLAILPHSAILKIEVTMEHTQYTAIRNEADVAEFQNIANGLHDGYITRVSYVNSGISATEHGHTFDYTGKHLGIHVLVTSLPGEPTFELVFHNVLEWQMKEFQFSDMIGFTILFLGDGLLLWADDICSNVEELKRGCYVIAESIQYRQL